MSDEAVAVTERYARRRGNDRHRYSLLNPSVMLAQQERQRAIASQLVRLGWTELRDLRLLEVGCGTGTNLVDFLRLGFEAEHMSGIELLVDSAVRARAVLPGAVRLLVGDAAAMRDSIPPASQDIVYQATVFSSILDDGFQAELAQVMWSWVRPGGGVLWYDFTVGNPSNPDVRGVPVRRVRQLFGGAAMTVRRLTLLPPLGRMAARIHPKLYSALNVFRPLKTHTLIWIQKPTE
jgi:SAM-dependent methyltransferase